MKIELSKKEPIDVFHERTRVGAMLQPMGLYYNLALQNAVVGDRLRMFDGEMAVVLGVCRVNMRTVMFRQLVKLLYGEYATPERVMERWIAHAVVMGNRENVISKTECLMIRFKKLNDEEEQTWGG